MKTGLRRGLLFIVVAGIAGTVLAGSPPLTFEERVAYQTRLEDLAHRYRVDFLPVDHRPPRSAAITDAQIAEKVRDDLNKAAALEKYWRRPITSEQLQAEMNRLARDTKQPERLVEMFAALGNDPKIIAECLARPLLADRLIRNWYAFDDRFHGDQRQQIAAKLAGVPPTADLKTLGGRFSETTLLQGTSTRRAENGMDKGTLWLNDEEWEEWNKDLRAAYHLESGAPLPVGRRTKIEESATEFRIRLVVVAREGEIRLQSLQWPKTSFDQWWAHVETELPPVSADWYSGSGSALALPTIAGEGCTGDNTWSAMRPQFIQNRAFHTAVWTGAEMVIWGGSDGTYLNSGGRYDPATDTWLPTSLGANVPQGRSNHAAIWTGTEMVVWGGFYYSGKVNFLNDGGRYSPITDSWLPMSTGLNVPAPRQGHTAVWTGTEMVVWGGEGTDGLLNSGGRYSPSTDSWQPTSTGTGVIGKRGGHTAIWTGTEMIVWGGFTGSTNLNTGGRYSPAGDSWVATSTGTNVPSVRKQHTAVWTGTKMVIWGGLGAAYQNTGGQYDPATDSWVVTSTGSNVPEARSGHTAVWTGTEILIWGGSGADVLNTGARYSPETDLWKPISTETEVPAARSGHTAVWTGTEMVVWGGYTGDGYLNTGGRYSPETETWVTTDLGAYVPIGRYGPTAVWTGTEMIVWGGEALGSLNSGGCYSPATDSWLPTSQGTNVPAPRDFHTAVWTGTEMVIWGGKGEDDSNLNSGGRYSPSTDSWFPTSTGTNVPSGRGGHSAVWTGTEMIIWGGSGTGGALNSGGRYFPGTDSWQPTGTGENVPSARYYHTAVWTGTEMIIWGGKSTSSLNTGGRYSPGTDSWEPTSLGENLPSGRYWFTAVWTGVEMLVWGGFDGLNYLNTGGRYSPWSDSWLPTSDDEDVPVGRCLHSAVWTGRGMVVWGGHGAENPLLKTGGRYSPLTDTWAPTLTSPTSPLGRYGHAAVWTGTEMIIWGGRGDGRFEQTGSRYCVSPGSESGSPKITVHPSSANLGSIKAFVSSAEKILKIKNSSKATLAVLLLELSGEGASEVEMAGVCRLLAPGSQCAVSLAATPSAFGSQKANLAITSTDPQKPVTTVKISWNAVPPSLSVARSVTFPATQVGYGSPIKIILIKNKGLSDLNISSMTLAGSDPGDFYFAGSCDILAKGQTCPLQIVFGPTSVGKKSASLVITSNDPKRPDVTIKLSGTGKE